MSSPPPPTFELRGESGAQRVVRGRVTLPAGRPPHPYVLLVHGHRGFMDWAFFPELAARLAAAGLAAVAFNLSGSGIGRDLVSFTEREAFAQNTYSREVADLGLVRRVLDAGELGPLDPGRGAVFGHSRGGGMALLHAAERGDYRAHALWAPMHRVALFGQESLRSFEQRGYIESPLASGESLRLERSVIDDARDNAVSLDIAAACRRLEAPTLLVYGSRDRLLAAGGRETLERALESRPPEVLVLEGAGHTLGARHPLSGVPPALEAGLRRTTAFLAEHLT